MITPNGNSVFFINQKAKKVFHKRKLLDTLPEYEVKYHCGMTSNDVTKLIPLFSELEGRKRFAIPLETKVLVFLSYLRSGSFQWSIGSLGGVSQTSASRIIESATNIIVSRIKEFIYFPANIQELAAIKKKFYDIRGFPNVIGCVDGTHVGIISPRTNESAFVNRKSFHSINLQVLADSYHCFTDIVVKYPGSTHDSFIWKVSAIRERLNSGDLGPGYILGDSGYPLEQALLTPYPLSTNDPVEKRYNPVHSSTRCVVERTIGTWKSRFRAFCRTGGLSCYQSEKVCHLIGASIALHNICRRNNIPVLEEDEEFLERSLVPVTPAYRQFCQGSTTASRIRRDIALSLR